MRIRILSLLILFNVTAFAQVSDIASKCEINSTISKGTIVIGDQVQYNISVIVPKSFTVSFPALSDSLMHGVELVKKPLVEENKRKDSKKELIMKMVITSFDSGSYQIPAAAIAISDNGITDTLKTSPLWLTVNTVPRDTTKKDICDIKAPIKEPITFSEVAPWTFGGLLVAALIFLLVIYIKRRKQNKPFSLIKKPIDPPHVIALRELEQIKEEKLWTSENYKYYYTRLIDVLRVYIEGRYDVNAMEQTSEEILQGLRNNDFPSDELFAELQETLSLSDLVKFAKFTPTIYDNERSLKLAFNFVEKTKQEVTPSFEEVVQNDEIVPSQEVLEKNKKEQEINFLS